jgi:hypothetical protein
MKNTVHERRKSHKLIRTALALYRMGNYLGLDGMLFDSLMALVHLLQSGG